MRLLTLLSFVFLLACNKNEEVAPDTHIIVGGAKYETVKIGTQTWTTTNYAGTGGVSYDATNSKPEYGKYFSKAELSTITLPEGWRIPTQADYTKLAQTYGIVLPSKIGETEAIKGLISQTNWNHVTGTNTSGFNAQPAGYIFGSSAPIGGDIAEFWTSEGITLSIQEAGVDLTSLRMVFYKSDDSPDYKFNVRFVKD